MTLPPPPPASPYGQGQTYQASQAQHPADAWMATQMGTPQTMPPVPPPAPPRKSSALKKALLFSGIGIVVLALVFGGVAYWAHQQQLEAERQAGVAAAEAARAETEGQAAAAGAVVTSYFTALAAGDVETVLGLAVTKPEGPLLAPEVVKAATKAGPVSDLKVEPAKVTSDAAGGHPTATVRASWSIGGTTVTKEWALTKSGADWKFDKVTAPVRLGAALVPYKVNEVEVGGTTTEALPGTYTVTPTMPAFQFATGTFTVTEPGKAVAWETEATPTGAALNEAKAALKASLDACLKQTNSFSPPNCPLRWNAPAGVTVNPGSVRIKSLNDPFANRELTHASGTVWGIQTDVIASATGSGRRGGTALTLTAPSTTFKAYGSIDLVSRKITWEASIQ